MAEVIVIALVTWLCVSVVDAYFAHERALRLAAWRCEDNASKRLLSDISHILNRARVMRMQAEAFEIEMRELTASESENA